MRRTPIALAAAGTVAALAVVTFAIGLPPTGSEPSAPPAPVRSFGHVYVIVLENHDLKDVLASSQTPFLGSLVERYGVAGAYTSIAHPSQPNYLALFSGSTQSVTDNGAHDIDAPSLADQLETSGRTWRVFAENVPPGCFTGASATGGRDGAGEYVRKHEPAISFRSISGSPSRCANIQDLSAFDPAAADFELIVPNVCNDMHSCPPSDGDRFLREMVGRIVDSQVWQNDAALFITFDEADDDARAANDVAMIVAAPSLRPGTRSDVPHDHYSLLRTIQDAWGLGCLAESCRANTLGEFFAPPP